PAPTTTLKRIKHFDEPPSTTRHPPHGGGRHRRRGSVRLRVHLPARPTGPTGRVRHRPAAGRGRGRLPAHRRPSRRTGPGTAHILRPGGVHPRHVGDRYPLRPGTRRLLPPGGGRVPATRHGPAPTHPHHRCTRGRDHGQRRNRCGVKGPPGFDRWHVRA